MQKKLINKLVSALSLPPEIDLSLPKLTMYGRSELLLENHRGVLGYTGDEARFLTEDGIVTIWGSGMELFEFSSERASLRGRINGWSYGDCKECGI